MMFPVSAEAGAMCAPLPRSGVGKMEVPCDGVPKAGPPDDQAGLRDVDVRGAEAKTSRTIALRRGEAIGAEVEIRKAEVIDERRAEHARDAQQVLVSPRWHAR